MSNLKIGDIVDLNRSFMGEAAGTLAVVYDVYENGGVQIITQNGVNIGGFSGEEAEQFLTFRKHTDFDYQFRSVMFLDDDWRKGVFKGAFA